ncbi:hypothetical protein CO613_08450 [Lysobacteraceae bacterium NML07-0707]|nr:hypothetical protein CO613_08450 [Xanthomonadaceae bacterium NML07-0707]
MMPIARLQRLWKGLSEQLWFKPAWWGVLATAVALMGSIANRFIAEDLVPDIGRDTLQGLLTIIASSMLAVSTFSLSILVQAFSSAASSASPRALRVIMADDNAQTAIAAFISAFIYSVIALMALGVGYYGAAGRFVLLLFTVVVMINVIIMLIRWINTLSRLGRMGYTIDRVEHVAVKAMLAYQAQPLLGGRALPEGGQTAGMQVHAACSGHIQHIDMEGLQQLAEAEHADIHVLVRPGNFVCVGQPIARWAMRQAEVEHDRHTPETDADRQEKVRGFIEVAADRDFNQDPRFGIVVLGEIGQRALSAAVNDGGTAIAVAGALARVLADCGSSASAPAAEPAEIPYPRVFVPVLDQADFIRDSFIPLQRDAGGMFEVQMFFIKVLNGIAHAHPDSAMADEARRVAWAGWLQARDKLSLSTEQAQLEQAAREVAGRWSEYTDTSTC